MSHNPITTPYYTTTLNTNTVTHNIHSINSIPSSNTIPSHKEVPKKIHIVQLNEERKKDFSPLPITEYRTKSNTLTSQPDKILIKPPSSQLPSYNTSTLYNNTFKNNQGDQLKIDKFEHKIIEKTQPTQKIYEPSSTSNTTNNNNPSNINTKQAYVVRSMNSSCPTSQKDIKSDNNLNLQVNQKDQKDNAIKIIDQQNYKDENNNINNNKKYEVKHYMIHSPYKTSQNLEANNKALEAFDQQLSQSKKVREDLEKVLLESQKKLQEIDNHLDKQKSTQKGPRSPKINHFSIDTGFDNTLHKNVLISPKIDQKVILSTPKNADKVLLDSPKNFDPELSLTPKIVSKERENHRPKRASQTYIEVKKDNNIPFVSINPPEETKKQTTISSNNDIPKEPTRLSVPFTTTAPREKAYSIGSATNTTNITTTISTNNNTYNISNIHNTTNTNNNTNNNNNISNNNSYQQTTSLKYPIQDSYTSIYGSKITVREKQNSNNIAGLTNQSKNILKTSDHDIIRRYSYSNSPVKEETKEKPKLSRAASRQELIEGIISEVTQDKKNMQNLLNKYQPTKTEIRVHNASTGSTTNFDPNTLYADKLNEIKSSKIDQNEQQKTNIISKVQSHQSYKYTPTIHSSDQIQHDLIQTPYKSTSNLDTKNNTNSNNSNNNSNSNNTQNANKLSNIHDVSKYSTGQFSSNNNDNSNLKKSQNEPFQFQQGITSLKLSKISSDNSKLSQYLPSHQTFSLKTSKIGSETTKLNQQLPSPYVSQISKDSKLKDSKDEEQIKKSSNKLINSNQNSIEESFSPDLLNTVQKQTKVNQIIQQYKHSRSSSNLLETAVSSTSPFLPSNPNPTVRTSLTTNETLRKSYDILNKKYSISNNNNSIVPPSTTTTGSNNYLRQSNDTYFKQTSIKSSSPLKIEPKTDIQSTYQPPVYTTKIDYPKQQEQPKSAQISVTETLKPEEKKQGQESPKKQHYYDKMYVPQNINSRPDNTSKHTSYYQTSMAYYNSKYLHKQSPQTITIANVNVNAQKDTTPKEETPLQQGTSPFYSPTNATLQNKKFTLPDIVNEKIEKEKEVITETNTIIKTDSLQLSKDSARTSNFPSSRTQSNKPEPSTTSEQLPLYQPPPITTIKIDENELNKDKQSELQSQRSQKSQQSQQNQSQQSNSSQQQQPQKVQYQKLQQQPLSVSINLGPITNPPPLTTTEVSQPKKEGTDDINNGSTLNMVNSPNRDNNNKSNNLRSTQIIPSSQKKLIRPLSGDNKYGRVSTLQNESESKTSRQLKYSPMTARSQLKSSLDQPENTQQSIKNTLSSFSQLDNLQPQLLQSGSKKLGSSQMLKKNRSLSNIPKQEQQFTLKDFTIVKRIGKGKFAQVYLAILNETNFLVALKIIQKMLIFQYEMEQMLLDEIKIQSSLDHPNIIDLYGIFDDDENIYLIQEFADGGNVYEEMKTFNQKRFAESYTSQVMYSVLQAVLYLHKNKIIHRDIKPENLLLFSNTIKIADFGCSVYSLTEKEIMHCGTLDYLPPEMAKNQAYGHQVDLWALGILTYELINGKPPFSRIKEEQEVYQQIRSGEIKFGSVFSSIAQDFIRKFCQKKPKDRMSVEKALKHEFITKYNSENQNGQQQGQGPYQNLEIEKQMKNLMEK